MKALKSKVILSAVVLLFALVATIGSTYAWFTVSQTVEVSSLQLTVESADNLLIRMEDPLVNDDIEPDLDLPGTYKTILTSAEVRTKYDYTGGGIAAWTLYPVTAVQSAYTSTDAKTLNEMQVAIDTNLVRGLTATATPNQDGGDYIQIKFWLYLQSTSAVDQYISLQDLSVITAGGNNVQQDNVVNAVRVAVWGDDTTYGVSGGPDAAVIFGIDNEYDFAFTSAYAGYSDYTDVWTVLEGEEIGTDQFNTIVQTDAITNFSTVSDGVFFQSVLLDVIPGMSSNTISECDDIFLITPETPTLFTVRIYIEGWDSDTINSLSAALFDISFKFIVRS